MGGRSRRDEALALIFVDSSAWIDLFNGRDTRASERLLHVLGREPIVLGDIVLTEVLQGFRSDRDFRIARERFSAFEVRPVLGEYIAHRAAENFRRLRRRGITVRKTIDTIIATFCIENGLVLLHSDRDFKPFAQHLGLREMS